MSKKEKGLPKVLNHDSMKNLLESAGWVATTGGKHSTKMEKTGARPITVPRHKGRDYGAQLRSAILREAGLKSGQAEPDDMESASGE